MAVVAGLRLGKVVRYETDGCGPYIRRSLPAKAGRSSRPYRISAAFAEEYFKWINGLLVTSLIFPILART